MNYPWLKNEIKLLKKLNTPQKISTFLANIKYKVTDGCYSPRLVMKHKEAHCFDGAFFAAAAMEFHGFKPLIIDLWAQDDDEHLLCVYQQQGLWGSIAKSNTSLLLERSPVYQSVRELVMSYFDMYFNYYGKLGLYAYSKPINLNLFNKFDWRGTDQNLEFLSELIDQQTHYEIIDPKKLKKMPKVNDVIKKACFLNSNLAGVKK
jgi:hypothetical protein